MTTRVVVPQGDLGGIGPDPAVDRDWLLYACASAAIFGHCYPVWHEFRGGKGAATTLGVLAAVAPVVVLPAMLAWFGTLFITGYVGLATIMASAAVPVYVAATDGELAMLIFTSLVAGFIAFTHRSNLRKLANGESTPDVSFRLLGRSR